MSDIAIKVENLSKMYQIGEKQERYYTFRDTLTNIALAPFRRLRRIGKTPKPEEIIWALKDVSLEVKHGEVVGIIGRNGAGKTTLLKILSRITEPTEGYAVIHGRVGSLLEVGTGFHPELTGRENIYLNGAILGMKKMEIERKFDEIIAFAEIEKFIDTPVKRYSSGMYVRLAFAVAAHLDPEILLVDEVLSVGDARFQRKCLSRMEDVGKEGRTVLFVSHNMPAIARLCNRVLLLDQGKLVKDGVTSQVIGAYLRSDLGTTAERRWKDIRDAPGNDTVRLRAVKVHAEDGRVSDTFDIRYPVGIQMEYWVLKPGKDLTPNIQVLNEEGVLVFGSAAHHDPIWRNRPHPVGLYTSTCWIPGNLMAEGTFIVGAAVSTMNPVIVHVFERDAVSFQIVDTTDGNSARGDYGGTFPGVVRPLLQWDTDYKPIEDLGSEGVEWGQEE